MRAEDLRDIPLFAGLTDAQLDELIDGSSEVAIELGSDLFHEGEPADFWWVLVDGVIALHRKIGREDTVMGKMDVPGRWAGGFRAWDEHGVYLASGRGLAEGRVLRVPTDVLRERIDVWFPLAGHLIRGVYGTARAIESTARQRESLITLGTLAAGLAHEINNPAAAATRSVSALDTACVTLLSALRRLAEGDVTAVQFGALDELRLELASGTAAPDPVDLADDENTISDWLGDHGVTQDWLIAPPLAAAGAGVEWCERAADVLGDALEPGLEWVASTLSAATLIGEVKESTRRITELVAAVRSYSQMDRGSIQTIDVTEGIESTLVMLGHKLRGGVEVIREYGADVPRIDAFAGELNQVWTNLIDNAVDAMDGAGTLRIMTRIDGDRIVVEFTDTGRGMPTEVAARAFEPFYTTKDVGKGTGLGLDIAQRIVAEHHGGTITITSQPGQTTLQVRLPRQPSPAG
ncbi:histidine kinase/DNA gyrase B/HSP90-like ATPase [Kribbella rubisoli]|uniref:histidine kinase n=1 Tax=Kribbella rubisoli TaxID=3075929 RepID=A0A4Q7XGH2_9ACTN|nr:ATP-binding protein [Kribbella rubisoli]RZU22334.1 histidine kinase/DNA gyrase B/HSP90-like ATPase [Kribbella rubisoli]